MYTYKYIKNLNQRLLNIYIFLLLELLDIIIYLSNILYNTYRIVQIELYLNNFIISYVINYSLLLARIKNIYVLYILLLIYMCYIYYYYYYILFYFLFALYVLSVILLLPLFNFL
jgi:hypothetical protein